MKALLCTILGICLMTGALAERAESKIHVSSLYDFENPYPIAVNSPLLHDKSSFTSLEYVPTIESIMSDAGICDLSTLESNIETCCVQQENCCSVDPCTTDAECGLPDECCCAHEEMNGLAAVGYGGGGGYSGGGVWGGGWGGAGGVSGGGGGQSDDDDNPPDDDDNVPIPEPSTWLLLTSMIAGAILLKGRKQNQSSVSSSVKR